MLLRMQGRSKLQLSQKTAMQLYDLKHLRLVRESRLDTKCLLAWNSDTLVLAFRGTASKVNAMADMKVSSPLAGMPHRLHLDELLHEAAEASAWALY